MSLEPCPHCARAIRLDEERCPFCEGELSLSAPTPPPAIDPGPVAAVYGGPAFFGIGRDEPELLPVEPPDEPEISGPPAPVYGGPAFFGMGRDEPVDFTLPPELDDLSGPPRSLARDEDDEDEAGS